MCINRHYYICTQQGYFSPKGMTMAYDKTNQVLLALAVLVCSLLLLVLL